VAARVHVIVWCRDCSHQVESDPSDLATQGADGRGIYLVFWFGNEASPTPARPDGGDGPRSARELESMLVGDLAPDLRARTDVIVLDVSDPKAPTTAAPHRKRSSKKVRIAAAAPPAGVIPV
jgi:hypothetical protein